MNNFPFVAGLAGFICAFMIFAVTAIVYLVVFETPRREAACKEMGAVLLHIGRGDVCKKPDGSLYAVPQ